MSCSSPAARTASSHWPRRSRVWISPDGQPVVAIRPLPYRCSRSRSMRGHLPICPSSEASDEARMRLCRPSLFRASSVMCVYEPRAETSSCSWPCWPNRTRVWSNRLVPGRDVRLDADDRLDARRRAPSTRSRTRRTGSRGPWSRSPSGRPARPPRTGRPAGPRRRASSTRCARGGGRSRSPQQMPCGRSYVAGPTLPGAARLCRRGARRVAPGVSRATRRAVTTFTASRCQMASSRYRSGRAT